MNLLIDMTEREVISLMLFTDIVHQRVRESGRTKDILPVLNALLERKGLSRDDIRGIAVVVGQGTFTGTRLAVTLANTFAYAQQIPIIAVTNNEKKDVLLMNERLEKATPGMFISATYSARPSIGGSQGKGSEIDK